MTNPGRLPPVLFFSLLSFWPSFCFSDFLISTIHYPLLVLWADVQGNDFCHTSWRCGFRSRNDLEARPKVTFTSVEISRHDCSSCVAKRAPESAGDRRDDPRSMRRDPQSRRMCFHS